jgi:hypothetical protein
MRDIVSLIMKHCLTGRTVSFYISLHPNSKTFYRVERSKARYKENLGSYNIRQQGKTSYEDKEVTNENSNGALYFFRIAETHNTQINLFSMTLVLKRNQRP